MQTKAKSGSGFHDYVGIYQFHQNEFNHNVKFINDNISQLLIVRSWIVNG